MPVRECVRVSGEGAELLVDASPGAARTEISGLNEWRGAIKVRIAAEPRDGRANEELLEFLSERLSVPRASLRIVRGERSSLKVVFVPLPPQKVRERLEVR